MKRALASIAALCLAAAGYLTACQWQPKAAFHATRGPHTDTTDLLTFSICDNSCASYTLQETEKAFMASGGVVSSTMRSREHGISSG